MRSKKQRRKDAAEAKRLKKAKRKRAAIVAGTFASLAAVGYLGFAVTVNHLYQSRVRQHNAIMIEVGDNRLIAEPNVFSPEKVFERGGEIVDARRMEREFPEYLDNLVELLDQNHQLLVEKTGTYSENTAYITRDEAGLHLRWAENPMANLSNDLQEIIQGDHSNAQRVIDTYDLYPINFGNVSKDLLEDILGSLSSLDNAANISVPGEEPIISYVDANGNDVRLTRTEYRERSIPILERIRESAAGNSRVEVDDFPPDLHIILHTHPSELTNHVASPKDRASSFLFPNLTVGMDSNDLVVTAVVQGEPREIYRRADIER